MENKQKNITNTKSLEKYLSQAHSISDLESYLDNESLCEFTSVSDYFLYIISSKKLSKSKIIEDSNLQRNYGYQILSGMRIPGRDKILMLCLAMDMNLEETNRALTLAKEGRLYAKDKRDSVLIYSINNQLSVTDTNDLLYEMQQQLLD